MTLVAYPPPPAENAAGARMAVLVVDDQPDNLLSAEAVLESLGEEVVTAESGAEALLRGLDRDFAVTWTASRWAVACARFPSSPTSRSYS